MTRWFTVTQPKLLEARFIISTAINRTDPNMPEDNAGSPWHCQSILGPVPLLSRLMRSDGNSGKLDAANVLAYDFNVIGQVRKDTVLYLIPEKIPGKRGAPRKMGNKIIRDMIDALDESIDMENFRP